MARRPSLVTFADLPTMPVELLTEFADAGFAPIGGAELHPHEPGAGAPMRVDLWTLSRFKQLMAVEGWPVQAARMIFDRIYAHERLAFAHTSANEDLRRLAMELFRAMHADDGLLPAHRH